MAGLVAVHLPPLADPQAHTTVRPGHNRLRPRTAVTAIPPNGWAEEDLLRLHESDDKRRSSASAGPVRHWRPEKEGFQELRGEIENSGRRQKDGHRVPERARRSQRQGRALLDPARDLALSERPVAAVGRIAAVLVSQAGRRAAPRNKLLILDCSRIDINWRIGILYNSFADRLRPSSTGEHPRPRHSQLGGPRADRLNSPQHLKGSVFGYFVAQACVA